MSRCSAGFIAFFFFGRFSMIVAMPSAMSTRMVSNVMTKRLSCALDRLWFGSAPALAHEGDGALEMGWVRKSELAIR